jgi:hypothetical protein
MRRFSPEREAIQFPAICTGIADGWQPCCRAIKKPAMFAKAGATRFGATQRRNSDLGTGQIATYFFSPFFVVDGLAAFGDGCDACAACKRHFWRARLSIVAGSNFSKNAFCSRADSSGVICFLVVVPSRFRMNISSTVATFPLNKSICN